MMNPLIIETRTAKSRSTDALLPRYYPVAEGLIEHIKQGGVEQMIEAAQEQFDDWKREQALSMEVTLEYGN